MVHQQVDWARNQFPMGRAAELASHLQHSHTPHPYGSHEPPEKQEMPASVPVVQQTADKIPSPVFVPQTFRLPQRIIEDLARAGELRALSWLDQEGNIWLPISSNSTIP
jgi:hypothetical protein